MLFRGWSRFRRESPAHGDKVAWLDGLLVAASGVTIVMDPVKLRKVPQTARVFVSHAHSDHTRGFGHKGLKQSTVETRNIHSALNNHAISNFAAIEIGRASCREREER